MKVEYCASAFVIDPSTKRILLVRHKKFNKWVQPGGHMESNEVPEETVVREVYEETHIKIRLLGDRFPRETDFIRPFSIQKNRSIEGVVHMDTTYVAVPMRDQKLEFDPNESTDIGWFTREELDSIDVFPDIKITMDYILEHIIH